MAMNDTLHNVTKEIISHRGEKIRSLFEAQIAAATEHLLQASVPRVGDIAPDFSLIATDGRALTLDEVSWTPQLFSASTAVAGVASAMQR